MKNPARILLYPFIALGVVIVLTAIGISLSQHDYNNVLLILTGLALFLYGRKLSNPNRK